MALPAPESPSLAFPLELEAETHFQGCEVLELEEVAGKLEAHTMLNFLGDHQLGESCGQQNGDSLSVLLE